MMMTREIQTPPPLKWRSILFVNNYLNYGRFILTFYGICGVKSNV